MENTICASVKCIHFTLVDFCNSFVEGNLILIGKIPGHYTFIRHLCCTSIVCIKYRKMVGYITHKSTLETVVIMTQIVIDIFSIKVAEHCIILVSLLINGKILKAYMVSTNSAVADFDS